MQFKSSAFLSLGLELELQLVNKNNHDLTPRAAEFIRNFSHSSFSSQLKPEITQSMLEINSSVHMHPNSLLHEVNQMRDALLNTAETLGVLLVSGGSHPFQMWHDRMIYPDPHYKNTVRKYGYLAKMFTVFGMHIHLGCETGDDAVYLINALTRFIPHFIALSASSPYCQGVDTGFDSSRNNVVKIFPLSGLPPTCQTWTQFCEWIDEVKNLQIANSINNFYWDIRPKPEFGTVEIRVCDAPLTIKRAVEIAAYAQCLARYILLERTYPITQHDPMIHDYNKHQASYNGFNAVFIDPHSKDNLILKDDILLTIQELLPHAKALDNQNYLDSIKEMIAQNSNDAKTLRDYFSNCQSMHELVSYQSHLFSNDFSIQRSDAMFHFTV